MRLKYEKVSKRPGNKREETGFNPKTQSLSFCEHEAQVLEL
jgi:hypothetical protein